MLEVVAENSEAAAVEPEAEGRPAMSCMDVAGLSREELNGQSSIFKNLIQTFSIGFVSLV